MADTLYALRHKATGLCMPQLAGGGYSYWEPTTDDHAGLRPRFFFSRRSACNARSAWAQGCWKREQVTSYDWEGIPDGYDDMVINKPPAPRALADLEVVVLELTEVQHA